MGEFQNLLGSLRVHARGRAAAAMLRWELEVMLPWLLFGVTFYFYSFRFHFRYGTKLPFVMTALIAICLVPAATEDAPFRVS